VRSLWYGGEFPIIATTTETPTGIVAGCAAGVAYDLAIALKRAATAPQTRRPVGNAPPCPGGAITRL